MPTENIKLLHEILLQMLFGFIGIGIGLIICYLLTKES